MNLKTAIIIVIVSLMAGCSTAGPFVTNIGSDGQGGLNIEKCSVHFNGWTGALSNQDCISTHVTVSPVK